MNERIRELEAQCWEHDQSWTGVGQRVFNSKKFAQLIAQECARLAMTQHTSTSPADYGDMEPYEQGCDDTASTISGLIRRTFGVE